MADPSTTEPSTTGSTFQKLIDQLFWETDEEEDEEDEDAE